MLQGGDWVRFHLIALDLVSKIGAEGWNAWSLRPLEQAPAGIAAALYVITGISKPWLLLPLNAFLHATAAVLLMLITGYVSEQERFTIWPILPFAFFPTALLWNTQFHKDNFFILGSYLFIYGFLKLILDYEELQIRKILSNYILLMSGLFLIWIVRPYGVNMVLYIGIALTAIMSAYLLICKKIKRGTLIYIGLIWLVLLVILPMLALSNNEHYNGINSDNLNDFSDNSLTAVALLETWQESNILPDYIDGTFYRIANHREQYLLHNPEAESNIDLHISFNSAGDVLRYIPRAIMIGLMAPFPRQWFIDGTGGIIAIMRLASGFEMVIVYIMLISLAAGCWLKLLNLKMLLTLAFSLGMILTFSTVVVNIGTLHRMRYGFLMVIVAIGIVVLQELQRKYLCHKKI